MYLPTKNFTFSSPRASTISLYARLAASTCLDFSRFLFSSMRLLIFLDIMRTP
ncbi:hypothetical protein HOT95_gp100 [Vibrio phage vB_VpS_PG07]|uniref:Uncharacterized protein n=1 Tax=Vibrio phage vB_VpS_PG07 TaxID=2301664 RepID=A0A385E6Y0_9CAUD|nr:hypothetical protein HOT95_gp100 [Vibrio phage vB_VpS_PG07]AXQ66725.1 hypothetical protein [Vibrio phage vB_VpS_PG07]